ncbi:MAG: hypothetical protein R3B49_06445 [Phycisphaerales bacterium]
MPEVYPFAVQFKGVRGPGAALVLPYDVLDAEGKAALLAKAADNIVAVDLPHVPAKELGLAHAYEEAGASARGSGVGR